MYASGLPLKKRKKFSLYAKHDNGIVFSVKINAATFVINNLLLSATYLTMFRTKIIQFFVFDKLLLLRFFW